MIIKEATRVLELEKASMAKLAEEAKKEATSDVIPDKPETSK